MTLICSLLRSGHVLRKAEMNEVRILVLLRLEQLACEPGIFGVAVERDERILRQLPFELIPEWFTKNQWIFGDRLHPQEVPFAPVPLGHFLLGRRGDIAVVKT